MQPYVTLITLGVDDLQRALTFYRDGLGFPTKGIVGTEFEHGAVAFFDLQPGLKLALWPRADLAHDTGMPRTASSPTELSLGHARYLSEHQPSSRTPQIGRLHGHKIEA